MSKRTKTYLFITFTLIFVIIPLFSLWIMFGRDILNKQESDSKIMAEVELLPLKYNIIIVLGITFLIVLINSLLIHFNIFEIKTITYILPFCLVMIALIYSGYHKEILQWWARVLIILAVVIIALPINIIVYKIEELQISNKIKQMKK